jgi:hypothetical protein
MTMLRARRVVSTAVVAILAAAGLSACQQSPDVAAYVGDETITQDRVQKIYDQVKDELTAAREQAQQQSPASPAASPLSMPIKQQDVLNTLLSLDVLRKSAQAHGVQAAAEPTVDQVAQSRNFSPSWEFTKLYTETYQLRAALQTKVPPATLTEADLRDVYKRLIAGGAADPSTKFEDFVNGLGDQNKTLLQTYVALRNELQTITTDEKVKLNPRYGDQQVTLLSAQSAEGKDVPLVVFTFAGDAGEDPYVTDVSAVTKIS